MRQLTPEDVIAILRRRWLLLAGLAVVGGGLGYGAARILPKRFTSETAVLVEQPAVGGDYVKPVITQNTNQRLASMREEILSRSRLDPVVRKFGLYTDESNHAPIEPVIAGLQKAIVVTPIEPMAETGSQGLPGFTVSVTYGDPELAQQICSTITSMFMEENSRLRQAQGEQTTQFFGQQLEEAKGKLDEQNAKLADFKRRYLGSLPDEEQTNLNVLTGLNSQLEATTQALTSAQQDKSFAETELSQAMAAWQANQNGQNPDTLETQLSALQNQLATLRSRGYTDEYPDVVNVKNDIQNLQKKIAESAQSSAQGTATGTDKPSTRTPTEPSQIQALRTQIHQYDQLIQERTAAEEDIQGQIKLYQSRVQSSPAIEQEYKALTLDYQTSLDFYNDLLRKRDQSAMATDLEKGQEGEQFEVLDAANLPTSPSFPKQPLFVMGGLGGGLGLGLAICLLIELMDTSLRTEKDVEKLLRLPVLAVVPAITVASAKKPAGSSFGAAMQA
jgi:polysaccharide chain length determinant protein (PEP-CTERM system associated)